MILMSAGQCMLIKPPFWHIQCDSYFSLVSSTSWLHEVLPTM